ncbi:MAG: hypothetical protein HY006_01170 [Candidatus Sungbacteria bacterium]|nr:hypothetical protein [Candidatus Sungbacteria bacterium]
MIGVDRFPQEPRQGAFVVVVRYDIIHLWMRGPSPIGIGSRIATLL